MTRAVAGLSSVVAALLLVNCGGSTDGGSTGGETTDSGTTGCGPMPGAMDCVDPCTGSMHGPTCSGTNWICDDPLPTECPGADAGPDATSGCGPMPGAMDCVDPCTGSMHGPTCSGTNWICDDPLPSECPDAGADADAGCAAVGDLVPVSCEPFPENTACDPFGTWSLSYDTPYPGICVSVDIDSLVIERDAAGIARVGFGSTASASLSADGCALEVTSREDWTNPSEYGTVTHQLFLTFSGDSGSGQLVYGETGLCSGTGATPATAQRLP